MKKETTHKIITICATFLTAIIGYLIPYAIASSLDHFNESAHWMDHLYIFIVLLPRPKWFFIWPAYAVLLISFGLFFSQKIEHPFSPKNLLKLFGWTYLLRFIALAVGFLLFFYLLTVLHILGVGAYVGKVPGMG